MKFPFDYLGFKIRPSKLKKEDWIVIIDKINNKLSSWNNRFLSRAGRLVLVNSVLSAIPSYWMAVHRFPKWVIEKIDRIRRNYLWNGDSSCRGYKCLVNWDMCCKSKKEGGLEIYIILTPLCLLNGYGNIDVQK